MNSHKVFGTVIFVFLLLAASAVFARGHDDSAAYRLVASDEEEITAPAPERTRAALSEDSDYGEESYGEENYFEGNCCERACSRPCCCPRWTATADAIIWDRIGAKTTTIFDPSEVENGFTTDDFDFGFRAGPRLSLIRHGDRCYDLELLYFMIDGWNSSQVVTPTQSLIDHINFDWGSRLYNAELNLRWNPLCRVAVLAGFRWTNLKEDFAMTYDLPLERGTLSFDGSFRTNNNLYGFQIGTDAKLLEYGCFSVDGLLKAGIYSNRAELTTTITTSYDGTVQTTSATASTSHTAFIGEVGLQGCYQVTKRLTLRGGYQVLWLDGVALAPSQFGIGENAIDSKDTVLYHGVNAGLEYRF